MVKYFTLVLAMMLFARYMVAQERFTNVFLPGTVSTDSVDFNACFSKDGNSFYFSRSVNKKTAIYAIHQRNGAWSAPELLPFCRNNQYSYADPMFSPAGELYFISNRPAHRGDTIRDYNIWKTALEEGRWLPPSNVQALNSPEDEYYISFTSSGDAYFSSSRAGGFGEEDIYFAKLVNGMFGTPVNIGPAVNSEYAEYDPFISPNGHVLIFAGSGRADSFGKADLYWSKKNETWDAVSHFDASINTPTRDFCPYISNIGQFFFSSEADVKALPLNKLPDVLKINITR